MKKSLVAYFSATGTTENVARKLAAAANADLFEIRPTRPYTAADLDWTNKNSRSTVEMNNPDSRPEIAEKTDKMDEYDVVFVGFPIWWYVAPSIIYTFLESYDFSGKTIVPFATSGGSGMGKTEEAMKRVVKGDNVKIAKGKVLNRVSESVLKSWIKEPGL